MNAMLVLNLNLFYAYLKIIRGYLRNKKQNQTGLPLSVSDAIHAVVRNGQRVYDGGYGDRLKLSETQKELILCYYYRKTPVEEIPPWVQLRQKRNSVSRNKRKKAC
jgi:hypothetical protein